MKSVKGREPVERAHLSVIGAGVVNSELMSKVVEGEETVGVIKALLILTMAAFDLAVVPRSSWSYKLVLDTGTIAKLIKRMCAFVFF